MIVVILVMDYQGQPILMPSVGIGLLLGVALYTYWPVLRPYVLGPKRERRDDDVTPFIFL
jgi:hypothetical protein